ncbi:MAG: FAD-binding protein [Dehalococcoidia bacterium]|nr:MAG: FAD-binding protein [Dehalococcoidia bacterium]
MLTPGNYRWDDTVEIVIIGYGLSGAVASITAHDLGARAVLLEKQSAETHCTCSSTAMGVFLSLSDIERATEYMTALCQVGSQPGLPWTDADTVKAWVTYTAQNKDWITRLGGNIKFFSRAAEFPQLPGADSMELWKYQGNGFRMMKFMYEQVASRNIDVRYQTSAVRLLTDNTGRVIGVKVADGRGKTPREINIRATKAVLLCTGGFEESEEMKLQYLRVYPMYFAGGTGNTGDGIRMAQEVGAGLWHMNCVSARLCAKFPDFSLAFFIDFSGGGWSQRSMKTEKEKAPAGFIIVDRYGRRYMTEELKPHAASYECGWFDSHRLEYPRVPSYHIFDQRRVKFGPLAQLSSGPTGPHQLYKWSRDNLTELQKGWIVKGDTVAELATKLNMPPENLENTINTWNRHCQVGNDPDFERNPLELVPLDEPPFFAIKLFPGGSNTLGGPRRNSRAQVLNPFGEPIPGLYAAGECGSVFGLLYPAGGGNLAECIAFGRIAAENAVREK